MFRIEDLFNCFPSQEIKANELMCGDIAYIHRNWIFVEDGELEKENYNNGMNYVVSHGNGRSYLPPEHKIKIVARNVLDKVKIDNFLTEIRKEQKELEIFREQEEREERQRIRYQRDELNRMLGDEDD